MGTFRLLKVGLLLTRLLPHRVINILCNVFGVLAYLLRPGTRRVVIANQRQVLGHATLPRLHWQAVRVLANAFRNYYALLRLFRLSDAAIMNLVELRGEDYLHAALARGHGVVILGAHMGNYNLLAPYIALYRQPAGAIVEPVQPPELFDFVSRLRARSGLRLFLADRDGVRGAMRLLRENGILAVTGDRYLGTNGTTVPFFGAPALLPHGAVVLALRTGATFLPASLRQLPEGRLLVELRPPLALRDTGGMRDDLNANMRLVARALEMTIAAAPEQWVLLNPVWDVRATAPARPAGAVPPLRPAPARDVQ